MAAKIKGYQGEEDQSQTVSSADRCWLHDHHFEMRLMSIISLEGAKLEWRAELITMKIHRLAQECQKLDLDNDEDYDKLMRNQDRFKVLEEELDRINEDLKGFIKTQKRKHLRLVGKGD